MSTRDEVLEALREAGEQSLSGEALAGSLGVSRVAVGKHVTALRSEGYRIEAVPGRGYALLGVPDLPLPAEVRRHLESHEWVHLEGGGATGSTNADAVALARAGAPHGTVVLASQQTAGRGRLGRAWVSPRGGVYASALLRPPLAPGELTGLPLAVAWGVASGVASRFDLRVPVGVKWPNDLVVSAPGDGVRGKLGGVLLEISAEADRTEWVVAGVGLNVRRSPEPAPGAACLADLVGAGASPGLAQVAAAVLDGISRGYRLLAEEGFPGVAAAVGEFDVLRGRGVCVRDIEGRPVAEGVAEGVDDTGRLRVRTPGDERIVVSAGDVTLSGGGV